MNQLDRWPPPIRACGGRVGGWSVGAPVKMSGVGTDFGRGQNNLNPASGYGAVSNGQRAVLWEVAGGGLGGDLRALRLLHQLLRQPLWALLRQLLQGLVLAPLLQHALSLHQLLELSINRSAQGHLSNVSKNFTDKIESLLFHHMLAPYADKKCKRKMDIPKTRGSRSSQ